MNYNGNLKNDVGVANMLGEKLLGILNPLLKDGCSIIHTEVLNETLSSLLDRYSGIDGVLQSKKDLAGVALRIQKHSDTNWGTFTIRHSRHTGAETEYSKRKRQIYNGYPSFYPHYTCQAYFGNKNNLLGGAFCKTKDLFDTIISHEPLTKNRHNGVYVKTNSGDGNTFVVIPFHLINPIVIIKPEKTIPDHWKVFYNAITGETYEVTEECYMAMNKEAREANSLTVDWI